MPSVNGCKVKRIQTREKTRDTMRKRTENMPNKKKNIVLFSLSLEGGLGVSLPWQCMSLKLVGEGSEKAPKACVQFSLNFPLFFHVYCVSNAGLHAPVALHFTFISSLQSCRTKMHSGCAQTFATHTNRILYSLLLRRRLKF